MEKCFMCEKKLGEGTAWSVCYDPEYESNVWGSDTHEAKAFLCNHCGDLVKTRGMILRIGNGKCDSITQK